jgi:hypothetical protein
VHTYRIPHGSVLTLVAGPGGMPWFAYGEVPRGLGRVVAGGTVQILPWRFFSEPTSMMFGPDGRLWFAANDFADAYGYSQSGASFVLVILDDFLAAVFVGGLVGTMIGLLPLRFLPGGTCGSGIGARGSPASAWLCSPSSRCC